MHFKAPKWYPASISNTLFQIAPMYYGCILCLFGYVYFIDLYKIHNVLVLSWQKYFLYICGKQCKTYLEFYYHRSLKKLFRAQNNRKRTKHLFHFLWKRVACKQLYTAKKCNLFTLYKIKDIIFIKWTVCIVNAHILMQIA